MEVGEKSLSSLTVLEPFYSLITVELYQDTPIVQLGDGSGLVFKGALCHAEGPGGAMWGLFRHMLCLACVLADLSCFSS